MQPEAVEVWPCNWKAAQVFTAMRRQWRTGPGGAIGLDYAALGVVCAALRLKLTPPRFEALRTMEAEALAMINAKRQ